MYRLWFVPRWQMAAAYATLYAFIVGMVLLAVSRYNRFADLGLWIIALVIGAVVFAGLTIAFNKSVFDRYAATIGHLDPRRRAQAYRASIRGPVPSDPAVRDGALRICQTYLEVHKKRIWLLYFAAAVFVLGQLLKMADGDGSGFSILTLIAMPAAVAADFYSARRYRARSDLLSSVQD